MSRLGRRDTVIDFNRASGESCWRMSETWPQSPLAPESSHASQPPPRRGAVKKALVSLGVAGALLAKLNFEVTPEERWIMGSLYFGLAAFLVVLVRLTHLRMN